MRHRRIENSGYEAKMPLRLLYILPIHRGDVDRSAAAGTFIVGKEVRGRRRAPFRASG
jgi:hypothetical protein